MLWTLSSSTIKLLWAIDKRIICSMLMKFLRPHIKKVKAMSHNETRSIELRFFLIQKIGAEDIELIIQKNQQI